MKNIFRWSAVIWFVIFVLLMSGLAYGLSGPLTRWSLQKTLQATSELPVTIDNVSVSLMPLSINISGVQWPDSENRQKNAFIFQQIEAKVRFGPLLRGNVIVDKATIGPVLTDQLRSTPWEPLPKDLPSEEPSVLDPISVAVKEKTNKLTQQASLSATEILSKEQDNLLIRKISSKLKAQTNELVVELNELQAASPKSSDIEALKSRYQVLQSTKLDSVQSIKTFESNWSQLKKEINTLKASSLAPIKKLDQGKRELELTFAELKQVPEDDWKRLSDKYQPGNVSTGALSSQLFGEKYSGYLEQGVYWYEKAKPWLPEADSENSDSESVALKAEEHESRVWVFPTDNPEPRFWLKMAALTLITDKGTVNAELQNWSSDLKQIKKLATADFRRDTNTEKLEGTLVVSPGFQTLVMNSSNQDVNNLTLMPSVSINKAKMNSTLNIELENKQLTLMLNNEFSASEWDNTRSDALPDVLTTGLASIENFDINIGATGSIQKPKLQISSDLDKKLGKIWNAELNKRWAKTQSNLEKALLAEMTSATNEYEDDVVKIDAVKDEIQAKSNELKDLMDGGMDQKVEEAKKEMQRKLDDKKKALESELKSKIKLPGF